MGARILLKEKADFKSFSLSDGWQEVFSSFPFLPASRLYLNTLYGESHD